MITEFQQFKRTNDFSDRTRDRVFDNPFKEGPPSKQKVKEIRDWISSHNSIYLIDYVKFYHATDPSIPVLDQGLLPTSNVLRRRSFQSTSGYVYLANTPERAKMFGDLGNQSRSVIYEVIVPVWKLKADIDQLNNVRSTGVDVGNSVAESIVYGGGVRIEGKIEPWQIKLLV